MYQQLPEEITLIDTGLFKEGTVACYLLESEGEVAIIETGHYQTTQRLLDLLEQKNIHREKVRYVIPTHVHLDHAGGAGSLIENLPNSMLVIHPRGARHMIDPSKLIAGAQAVYGEQKFREYYGDIKGIAEERVIIAEDNDQLTFGNRTLLFKDTPGHANHHFCVWDEQSAGWFTGDTFGIAYAQFSKGNTPLLFPTTTPVQFNPAQLIDSVKMMMRYQPKHMYLTHFGAIDVTGEVADALCKKIQDYADIVTSLPEEEVTFENIHQKLQEYNYKQFINHGINISKEAFLQQMSMDFKLNSHGLKIWYDRCIAP
ncbi:MAG: MBL fold metallo-hydrolase [Gammaproteobacteria bacterium]|nr:MBL fold metallo-hydrolase [Gammaproteobacteria bacterium]